MATFVCFVNEEEQVVFLSVDAETAVPASAVVLAERADPPLLDINRAHLYSQVNAIVRDAEALERSPYLVDEDRTDERDHHLLVFEQSSSPGPLLQRALEIGRVDHPAPGAYLTRTPHSWEEVRRWAREVPTFIAGVSGTGKPGQTTFFEEVLFYEQDPQTPFLFHLNGSPGLKVGDLPPQWQEALENAVVCIGGRPPSLRTDELPVELATVGPRWTPSAKVPDSHRATRTQECDDWPAEVFDVEQASRLPPRACGCTLLLRRRFSYSKSASLVVLAGLCVWALSGVVFTVLLILGRSDPTWLYWAVPSLWFLASATIIVRSHDPWSAQVSDRDVVCRSLLSSPRRYAFESAEPIPRGPWTRLVDLRKDAHRAELSRAQLTVAEWLEFTVPGREHVRERRRAGRTEQIFVATTPPRPVDANLAWTGSERTGWSFDARAVLDAADGAAIVLVPRRWTLPKDESRSAQLASQLIILCPAGGDLTSLRRAAIDTGLS